MLACALACGSGPPPTSDWVVVATLDGATPEDVEALLLTPLEVELMAIPGLERLEGWADEGVATVKVRVRGDDPSALHDALRDTRALPPDADAPVIQRRGASAWFAVPLQGSEDVALRLTREAGVQAVDVHGVRDEQIVITVDGIRLVAYGLDLTAIADALAKPVEWPGGRVEGEFLVGARPGRIENLEEIVVGVVHGVPVRLGDVASLEWRFGDPRALHGGEAVALLEIASDRPDLADLVGGTPLAGHTRVDLVALGDWARAFSDEPDTTLLLRDGGGTAWIADPARAQELALAPGIDGIVRSGVCGEEAVYADTIDDLERAVEARRRALAQAVVTTWTGWAPARTDLQVVVDRERAAAAGLSTTEIAAAAGLAGGRVVASFQEGGRLLDVVLELDQLDDLRVRGVPLGEVARLEHGRQRAIPHVDGRRGVYIEVCGDARALAELGIAP